MKQILCDSAFFGLLVSILTYEVGLFIKKKLRLGIFNPLLIAIILTIVILILFGIDYESYSSGAKYLSYLLTPATVCLAIPLYEQISLLKDNWKAVFAGIISGVISSLGCVLVMAILFGLNHAEYVTLLPKSITTAIGMGVAEELGGDPSIAAAVIIITGVLGNMMGEAVLKLAGITEPIARGVALGTSSHAIGTAKAMELGETEGAMSSLSIAAAGLFTVVGASVFAQFL
ncbi:MAG: LrgB family protein [Huintestinicola sp.]